MNRIRESEMGQFSRDFDDFRHILFHLYSILHYDYLVQNFGVRSMVAPLKRVLVSTPATTGDFAAAGWQKPNPEKLLQQHRAFCDLLTRLGCEVICLEPTEGLVDACFPYDPVFVTGSGAIELQMAKPARVQEPPRLSKALEAAGVPTIGKLNGNAIADGGDMFWLDQHTLAVGRGYRTNAEAHRQLGAILDQEGVTIERCDLPHHLGAGYVLHLLSLVSPVAEDLAVVFEPLAPVPLLESLKARKIRWIKVGREEWETQGCNILAVRPGVLVMTEGNPKTVKALEAAGCEVHLYEASEINKGEGGPTCLTRPVWRQ
jgi:N-dimethylarginine dimethylaminohydrolase